MQPEQESLVEEWITARNRAVVALRAAHITVADIALIQCCDAAEQSWHVLEIADPSRLDRFIPLSAPSRELIESYWASRPETAATHLFVDTQGIALTAEQIAEIVGEPKLTKRRRSVARAAGDAVVPVADCTSSATLLAYAESSEIVSRTEPASRSASQDGVEDGAGEVLLDIGSFPHRFAVAVEAWANQLKADGKATATIGCYARAIRKLIVELSDILGAEITLENFRQLDRASMECWRTSGLDSGVSAATIDQHLAAMRSFVRFLIGPRAAAPSALSVGRTRASSLPATISAVEMVHDVIRAEQFLSDESWINRRQHAVAALIADTGATPAEITAATVSCLKLDEQPSIVLGAHTVRQRVIELKPATADLIACYLAACPSELADATPLFTSQEGAAVSTRTILQGMHRLSDAFGLPGDINARSVRRGAIAAMHDSGLSDFEIAERLKVSSLEGVAQILRETGRVCGPPITSVREKHSAASDAKLSSQGEIRAFIAWCVEEEELTYRELAAWERLLQPLLEGSLEAAKPEEPSTSEPVARFLDQLRCRLTSNYRLRQRASRIMLQYSAWMATPDRTTARGRAAQSGEGCAPAAFLGSLLRGSELTLGTVANYGLDVARFAEFIEGRSLDIGNVQPSDVELYMKQLVASAATQATARRALAAIRKYFDWTEATGHSVGNPAKASMIQLSQEAEASAKPHDASSSLTPDAADALIDALSERESERHLCTALIASFASNEGLELREILSLRRSAIVGTNNAIASAIVINRQDIVLSRRTRQLIARYASQDFVHGDGTLIRASSLGARSGSLFRQTVAGHLKTYGQAVGFPRVNLRALRTSYVSRLVRTGLDYELVRRRARLSHVDQVVRSIPGDLRAQA